MNSTVGPIFNESFIEKEVCGSCDQCTRPIGKAPQPQKRASQKKKKKKKKEEEGNVDADVPISSVPKWVLNKKIKNKK